MGRIHDALKKAEEERKKKRAQKEQEKAPVSDRSVPHQETESIPAAPVMPKRSTPRAEELPTIPEPEIKKKSKKKGIAAGLKRAQEAPKNLPQKREQRFGELLLTWHAPSDQRSEQIRSLRTNIVNLDPSPKLMAFASAVGDEGASLTAANLAVSFAEDRRKNILLVDANLRSSNLSAFFDVSADAPGFKEILEGRIDPDKAVIETGVPSLYMVTAGGEAENPGALLSSQEIQRIFADYRKRFDRILVVMPPVEEANDAAVIGREIDGTVMVIKLGSTPRRETEHALESLAHSGVRVLGCVVTNAHAVKDPTNSNKS